MDVRQAILTWCYLQSLIRPRIYYCTGVHRFGPYCRDCSGMVHEAYRSVGLLIGTDTGVIALDVVHKAADFFAVRSAIAGDLLMRRDGSFYNGGSDEHVGIFVRLDGAYVWTWESAGSQGGHGLYRRPISFWNDCVRYRALAGSIPTSPIPPLLEAFMFLEGIFVKGDITGPKGDQWWYLVGNRATKVLTPAHRDFIAINLSGTAKDPKTGAPDKSIRTIPMSWLDTFVAAA